MRKYVLLTVCLLLIANLIVGVQLLQKPNVTAEIPVDDGAVALVRPWFIDQALASEDREARAIASIADEAGMAAYAKSPAAITLSRVTPLFTGGIEVQTSDYIIGLVPLTGYLAHWNVHVLVHKNGWVMAWYHKDWPAINILDTRASTFGTSTKLSLALTAVGGRIGQTLAPTYYDFAFPDATKLLMINKMRASGSTVRISLPASFLYYDKGLYADVSGSAFGDEVFINSSRVYICCDVYDNRYPDAPERFVDIDANLLTDRVNTVTFETTYTTEGYEFDIFIVYNDA
jgi:hypothetical protein